MKYELILGDCLDVMRGMADKSVSSIITDLPYGSTQNTWDEVIPFAPMWEQIRRVLQDGGAFVTTATQPFASRLVTSNLDWFKWEDIWHKSHATGHLNCKVMPLREHENILVFGKGRITYNPQVRTKPAMDKRVGERSSLTTSYGKAHIVSERTISYGESYPRSVVRFQNNNGDGTKGLHPTQKPVALYSYLILTYTNPGDTVLDFCMGSGTTGVAAIKEGRNFIGCEDDAHYFGLAQRRIEDAAAQPMLFEVTA
jgi:site-specific DNA-methyltransferase (adenine-specific)